MSCKNCEVFYIVSAKCMFGADGAFQSDNWRCATACMLRDLAEEREFGSGERNGSDRTVALRRDYETQQSLAVFVLPGAGKFVILGWYKSRGRTEIGLTVEEGESRPLTFDEAEAVLEYQRSRAAAGRSP